MRFWIEHGMSSGNSGVRGYGLLFWQRENSKRRNIILGWGNMKQPKNHFSIIEEKKWSDFRKALKVSSC